MRIRITYRTWIAILGGLIFITGALFSDFSAGPTDSNIEYSIKELRKFLSRKTDEGQNICQEINDRPFDKLWSNPVKLQDGWDVIVTGKNSVIFWTNNQTSFDSALLDTGAHLRKTLSGWDFYFSINTGTHTISAVYPLTRISKGSVSGFNKLEQIPGLDFNFTSNKKNSNWISGYDIGLMFTDQKDTVWNIHLFFWIGVILLFFSVLPDRRTSVAWHFIIIVLAVVFRVLLYKDLLYHSIRSTTIFDPRIYASSFLLPSLGDLTVHILCSMIVVLHLGQLLRRTQIKPYPLQLAFLWAILTGTLFLMDMLHSIVKGLVLDSHISFDITNLSGIDRFTALALALITGSLVTIYYFLHQSLTKSRHSWQEWIIIFLTATAGFIAFQMIDGKARLTTLMPSIFMVGAFIAGLKVRKLQFWITSAVLTMLASVFMIQTIQENLAKKENEFLKIYSSKLIANKDLDAENRFLEIEKDLVSELIKPEDFENFSKRKDQFEKRLRRIYFSGHLDRYDLKILNYDSSGKDLDESNFINFKVLNHLYNDHSYPTLSSYFFQIKDPSLQNSFVAKFENCDIHGHYGNVFILLQPKLIQTSYTYPSLLERKMGSSLIDMEDNSYAIYSGSVLLQQRGNYPYPMQYAPGEFKKGKAFSGYKHFVLDQNNQNIAVLSYPNRDLLIYTSGFTFIFLYNLFLIATSLLILLSVRKWNIRRQSIRNNKSDFEEKKTAYNQFISYWGFEQPLLSTRVQFAMIAVVSLGLLISVYFTIKYVEFNYNQRIEDELVFNMKEVSNHLQNEVNTDQKITNPESRLQLINQISNIYKLEANLFGTNGKLLASSGPELYNEGVLSTMMDYDAYRAMHIHETSQFIHKEWIRDLSYLSAYVPVLNERRQVVAYLNLPYFTQQKELDKEISSYTVTLVNVYILLFIFALFLAYFVSTRITKPLKLIRDKIAATTLTAKNEMLDWKRNDEIGQLIRQYNKMVMELEESARKLSTSEREGAWKEMARQVAHEIKNPLTPMKLNVQHLQRAWKDEHPNLPATFERVTKVLIEQIDSLSRLAGEFSSFAQMPQTEFALCPVNQLLTSTIHLFEKSENIDIEYEIPDNDVLVYADEEQLSRAFNNIIKNAIQSIPEDRRGLIEVEMEVNNDQVVISITDNGSGISKDKQKKIFTPNFSTKTSGMGLGLAITKKIIETTGGSIGFVTEEGKGTTFSITLPLHKA